MPSTGKTPGQAETSRSMARNMAAIAEVEEAARRASTPMDRVAGHVARFIGTSWYIGAHLVWFVVWIGWNLLHPDRAFDPFPFEVLTLIVALEAILLSAFVLMSQNRMTAIANRRAHIDLQINLLAEAEMTEALGLLHRIGKRLGLEEGDHDDAVRDLATRTDVLEVAKHVDEHLAGDPATAGEPDAELDVEPTPIADQ